MFHKMKVLRKDLSLFKVSPRLTCIFQERGLMIKLCILTSFSFEDTFWGNYRKSVLRLRASIFVLSLRKKQCLELDRINNLKTTFSIL